MANKKKISKKTSTSKLAQLQVLAAQQYNRSVSFIKNRKVWMFGFILLLFIGLFSFAIFTNEAPEEITEQETRPLQVNAITFGETTLQEDAVGIVKNLTTLTLVAQSSGPVSSVRVSEGDKVYRGTVLVQQESAYAAGSAPAVQAQVAAKNLELAEESLQSTSRQVSLSREQADKSRQNTEELRKISEESIDETERLVSISEQIVESLEDSIEAEESGTNDQETLRALRGQLLTYTSSLNQARSSLRSLEYQTSTDSPQYDLADIQKDLVFASTELQLETAQIQKEIAQLNVRSAQIAAAATRVTSPIAGTVERILVEKGAFVSAGTPVAVVKGETQLSLEVQVAGRVALQVNPEGLLNVELNSQIISLPIDHVSAAPVNGQMYQILASIPAHYERFIFENQTVSVRLPLYEQSVDEGNLFVPLDALFVSNTGKAVFTVEKGKAVRKEVETGEIVGTSIEVKSGLMKGDIVILDRRVIDQQQVEYELTPQNEKAYVELG